MTRCFFLQQMLATRLLPCATKEEPEAEAEEEDCEWAATSSYITLVASYKENLKCKIIYKYLQIVYERYIFNH